MSSDALLKVMTAAVVISAICMVAMAAMVFGMLKAMMALREQVTVFMPKAEKFINTAEKTIADNQGQIKEITAKAASVLDTTQKNLVRVDSVVDEATQRARVQMERLELIMDDTVNKVHNTVTQFNSALLRPMREITGVASGVRAAVQTFVRGNRPSPAQATSDEEMFI